ncbi:MAG TPA: FAD-dependent oxidoreductase [Gemmatimonadales bacterium]|nr:FAD-dependent oxidoreductase [Gemmatimonadales bacterium]
MRDLLVVGGGPAGASTAAWAARDGLDVLLVERHRFPREKACSEYLSPEAARDLDALGVLDALEAGGAARLTGMRIVADDGSAVLGRFPATPGLRPYRPYGIALPRSRLDAIVLAAAATAGADVRQEVAVERLVVEDGAVCGAVLRQGDRRWEERSRVLVGADGLHSLVAARLGLSRRRGPRRLAVVAHLADVDGMGDYGEMFVGRGRYVGLAPIGRGLVNAAAVVPASEARTIARDPAAFLRAQLAAVPELRRRLALAREVRRAMVAGPFARSTRSPIAHGALLVGDAADFFDPFTGEGIYAALRGGRLAAETLAAALAAGRSDRTALRPYRLARRRAFLGKWAFERVAALSATRPAVMRRFTHRLARRPSVADLWVGVAGDYVPPRALLAPRALAALIL